jgi:hypothetical protein
MDRSPTGPIQSDRQCLGKSANRTSPVLGLHISGKRVNQDPAHEIAGLEYLFANKKDFGGDDNARQKLGSVLI